MMPPPPKKQYHETVTARVNLLRSGVHPNPGPLRVLSWNMNRYKSSRLYLEDLVASYDPDIIHIQESWLKSEVSDDLLQIKGFDLHRRDRVSVNKTVGGGLLSYFKCSLHAEFIPEESCHTHVESLYCKFKTVLGTVSTCNIYIPPDALHLPKSLVLSDLTFGDFNAHHESWSSKIPRKASGRVVSSWILDNGLAIIQLSPSIPTHGTTPDLALHSPQFKSLNSIQIDPSLVNSDHTPIITDFDITPLSSSQQIPAHRKFFHDRFKESHWKSFTASLESHCPRLNNIRSLSKLCKALLKTIDRVAISTLPNKWYPLKASQHQRSNLNAENILLQSGKRGFSWTYKKLRELKGEATGLHTPSAPLESLHQRFFPTDSRSDELQIPTVSPQAFSDPSCRPFSTSEAQAVLDSLKRSDSTGPDAISNNMLLHLGEQALHLILRIANWSFYRGTLPKCLKVAHVIPTYKGNKRDPTDAASYRPISLTSILSKFIESLMLSRLEHLLIDKLDPKQSGFVPGRTTDENIAVLINAASETKSDYLQCAVLILFDISGAFDNVDHNLLMDRIKPLLPTPFVRWIGNFLSDRTAHLLHGSTRSKPIACTKGVPQGSILGPLLFRMYVDSLPESITVSDTSLLYADDLAVYVSSSTIDDLEARANKAIGQVECWLDNSRMSLSHSKTEYMSIGKRFTEDKRICRRPRLYFPSTVDDVPIPRGSYQFFYDHIDDGAAALLNFENGPIFPLGINGRSVNNRSQFINTIPKGEFSLTAAIPLRQVKQTRYLGVIIDDNLTFESQKTKILNTLKRGIALLSMVSSYQVKTEVLRQVIFGLILSRAYYGLAAFAPLLSKKAQEEIELTQRVLQRKLTGCLNSTATPALSVESGILPFKLHLSKSTALMNERFLRNNKNSPSWSILDPEKTSSIWKTFASIHSNRYPTPSLRSYHCLPHHQAPWEPPPDVTFNPWREFRKSLEPVQNLEAALSTMKNLPPAIARLYTDASYFQDKEQNYRCGNAACLIIGNKCFSKRKRYTPALMIYNAEQQALLSAVELLEEHSSWLPRGRVHIITDSQSSVSSLAKGYLRQRSTTNMEILKRIMLLRRPITFQFVPSHCGIIGNELADSQASKAASSDTLQITEVAFDYRMVQCSITNQVNKIWLRERDSNHVHYWSTLGGRIQRFHPNLKRADEVHISRLRTGHHHLIKIPSQGLTNCNFCNEPLTSTHHLLFNCLALRPIVQQYFPPTATLEQGEMDVGQNLHKFFSTEHQPELMKLIMKLHELPLWQAIPQQHLMEHLYKWTSFPTFNTATRKTVVAYIKEAYTLTDIEEIHTNLDWVWMYCYPDYLNNDTSMKKLLDKIQDSQYSRIDAAWFNRQVR